ncbi:MAG TPA: FGGY-family carbohydrate kinase [Actinomycetota bacterium]
MSLVLALDVGTSGGRALIADSGGKRIGSAERRWRYRTDPDGFPVLDTGSVWASLASATREAVRSSLARPEAIAVIGITSQRNGVALLDSKGQILYAGPDSDGRAANEGIALEREHGDLIYETTGRLPAFKYLPARLAWFRGNKPDIANRTAHALSFGDWIAFRLTGEIATDPTQAAETMCFDVRRDMWSQTLCDALDVPSRFLPRVMTEPLGRLPEDVAREFGLHPGTPVVRAGADTQCAALAMGAREPGDVAINAGTMMPVSQVQAEAIIDEQRRLVTSPHVVPGRSILEVNCGEAGALVDWLLALIGEGGNHLWLEQSAGDADPGSRGVAVVDPGPINVGDYPVMRSGGLAFPIPVSALNPGREEIARAVLEGVAYAARAGIEWLQDASGRDPGLVTVCGGLSRSPTFVRILAGVMGREVRRAREPHASALGAAIVAATAAGLHPSVAAAAAKMADAGELVRPDPSWLALYDGLYQSWTGLRARYEETMMSVSDLRDS